jgi:hypothetical protein
VSKSDEEKSEGKLNLGLAQILSPALSSLDLAAPIPKPIENRAVEEMIPPHLRQLLNQYPRSMYIFRSSLIKANVLSCLLLPNNAWGRMQRQISQKTPYRTNRLRGYGG